jgi:predicted negative regulator of RcsB-dependent stress response
MNSETQETAGLYDLLAWLEINKKRLMIGAAAVTVIGIAISFFVWRGHQQEIAANAELLNLGLPITMGEKETPPPSATAFLKLANDYSGTKTSEKALLLAATAFFDEGRYQDALTNFKKIQTDLRGSELAGIASLGVAACLDATDKLDEAIAAYLNVSRDYPTLAMQAKLSLARLYEAKKQPEQAFRSCNEVAMATTSSAWADDARQYREQLVQKYPQAAALMAARLTNSAPVLAPKGTNSLPMISTNKPAMVPASTNGAAAKPAPAPATAAKPAAASTNK